MQEHINKLREKLLEGNDEHGKVFHNIQTSKRVIALKLYTLSFPILEYISVFNLRYTATIYVWMKKVTDWQKESFQIMNALGLLG